MANIYVRKSGSDSNDGSTPALAKLTIAGAISAMVSGDTIYVGSGVYKDGDVNADSKDVTIIGDTTGEYTGDAGEVIWSGLNATDDSFTLDLNHLISSSTNNLLSIKNILFENIKFNKTSTACIKKTIGTFVIEDCMFNNIFATGTSSAKISFNGAIYITDKTTSSTIKNVYIDNVLCSYCSFVGIVKSRSYNTIIENLKISNVSLDESAHILRIEADFSNGKYNLKNVDISNIYGRNDLGDIKGIELQDYNGDINKFKLYNCSVHSMYGKNVYGFVSDTNFQDYPWYNISCFNLHGTVVTNNYWKGRFSSSIPTSSIQGTTDKANYTIPKISPISKYSPLRGQGYTEFPTTDIEGNPRPAYGNGTKCDIGASEATSEDIQQESVIKDTGDYSAKVSPCNYFKRQFQIPVTASELRTVKVKIRIDGTWGTYLPRVSLSGQGMTLSQATKNSTTGSFEELTVSGTPTTTGIALLTIEAHSPNTDAAFYIDTITIE